MWDKLKAIVLMFAGLIIGGFILWSAAELKVKRYERTIQELRGRLDSLQGWQVVHPPARTETTIVTRTLISTVKVPVVVKESVLFIPDSLIARKYPKAIWRVIYQRSIGRVSGVTYDGKEFESKQTGIGSFVLQGDTTLTLEVSSVAVENFVKPQVPFGRWGVYLFGCYEPDLLTPAQGFVTLNVGPQGELFRGWVVGGVSAGVRARYEGGHIGGLSPLLRLTVGMKLF